MFYLTFSMVWTLLIFQCHSQELSVKTLHKCDIAEKCFSENASHRFQIQIFLNLIIFLDIPKSKSQSLWLVHIFSVTVCCYISEKNGLIFICCTVIMYHMFLMQLLQLFFQYIQYSIYCDISEKKGLILFIFDTVIMYHVLLLYVK